MSEPVRVIVTGSRETGPAQTVFVRATLTRVLGPIALDCGVVIVEGECPYGGVDRDAREWAREHPGASVEPHPAKWHEHGKAAGPIRNGVMVARGARMCLGFPGPDSSGTWDCLKQAARAGIPGRIYPLP